MSDPITPPALARELAHADGGRKIRAYLRATYGTLPAFVSRWQLTDEQAADVRAYFRSRA